MPKSYRFPTKIGTDREVRINIEQDFDFLEILSLKLKQEDIYSQFCADYGVVAGRVVANGGFGIPNVNLSIFVPLDAVDENDPIISTLYPYKNLTNKNEDGYRYNLLPYTPEYLGHTPTGTFPSRMDVLTRKEVLEIYEKYYKYTVRTNDSGDFMIVGVPLGSQKLVMDLDLSNIGEFSLTPDDLIRMGMGVENDFNGQYFKSSEDLDSLPQIVTSTIDVDVNPFWGQDDLCNVGITRADFDLRDLGIDIQPNAIFMGSIFSSTEDDYIKTSCKPKKDMGELCDTSTGPGTILSIRQGNGFDNEGNPVLEEYVLENGGNIIDEDGTWLVNLPMNLEYIYTDEFGNQKISPDGSIGIPTTAKYRFRVKWQNEQGNDNTILRADYLIPNIKERGWTDTQNPPSDVVRNKSYAFSLEWDDYADVQSAIECKDTFYKFRYNKVYTIANHIDRIKWGTNRRRFYGIKEINDKTCQSEVNRFPVNDGVKNSNLLIFLFNLFLTILTPAIWALIPLLHVVAIIWGVVRGIVIVINTIASFFGFEQLIPLQEENPLTSLPLPMLSYPDCDACACTQSQMTIDNDTLDSLSQFSSVSCQVINASSSLSYVFQTCQSQYTSEIGTMVGGLICSGHDSRVDDFYANTYDTSLAVNDKAEWYKSPVYPLFQDENDPEAKIKSWRISSHPTLAQSLNLMNRRFKFFDTFAPNRIKTTVVNDQFGESNSDPLYDNCLIVVGGVCDTLQSGQIVTFNRTDLIQDSNLGKTYNLEYNDSDYITKQIKTIKKVGLGFEVQNAEVKLHNTNPTGTYEFKSGVEYYQVITAMTYTDYGQLYNAGETDNLLYQYFINHFTKYGCDVGQSEGELPDNPDNTVYPRAKINNYQNTVITFLVRGVDVYTPKQKIEYDLSKLFGYTGNGWDDFTGNIKVTGNFYLNYPIQDNLPDDGGCSSSYIPVNSWRNNIYTPTPHFARKWDISNDLIYYNTFNSNVGNGLDDSGTLRITDLPNLFHKPFLMINDDEWSQNWTQFNSYAINKYVSVDTQLDSKQIDIFDTNCNVIETLNRNKINGYDSWAGYSDYAGIHSKSYIDYTNNDFSAVYGENQGYIEGCGYQYSRVGGSRNILLPTDVITFSSGYLADDCFPNSPNEGTQPYAVMSNSANIIFRSDRIPLSDVWDEPAGSDLCNDCGKIFRRYGLHLNSQMQVYQIGSDGDAGLDSTTTVFQSFDPFDNSGNAADDLQDAQDTGNVLVENVIDSFGCDNMVPLCCYNGEGVDFEIDCNEDCYPLFNTLGIELQNQVVVNGCYRLVTIPLVTLLTDYALYTEWNSRIRFTYALCQGIISEMFHNNWVNGTLYMPSFQKVRSKVFDDTETYQLLLNNGITPTQTFNDSGVVNVVIQNIDTYSVFINDELYGNDVEQFFITLDDQVYITGTSLNQNLISSVTLEFTESTKYKYCGSVESNVNALHHQGPIYYNSKTSSFYYRSTPYSDVLDSFIGQSPTRDYKGANNKNIWYPTTIMDLGPKTPLLQYVSLSPYFQGYIIDKLKSTSYQDNSQLVNLFAISRLASSSALAQFLNAGDASVDKLFSREGDLVDGDHAQMLSINSEIGTLAFLEGNYPNENIVVGGSQYNISLVGPPARYGVFYDSDIILKRYINNGYLTYTPSPQGPAGYFGYPETQEVPNHRWYLFNDGLFGNGRGPNDTASPDTPNEWYTKIIQSTYYQNDDFYTNPTTYVKTDEGGGVGYIYNVDSNGNLLDTPPTSLDGSQTYKVGSPFYFYFGLKRGKTALNRFFTKYILV